MPGRESAEREARQGTGARAHTFEYVVETCEGKVRVSVEHALAMSVELFGDLADALFLQVVGGGERERIEGAQVFAADEGLR